VARVHSTALAPFAGTNPGTAPNFRVAVIQESDCKMGIVSGESDEHSSSEFSFEFWKDQLALGTLNRYLLILKRLIFESSVRAGSPSLVAAPEGPETRP